LALPILSELNAPLLVHAELPEPLDAAAIHLENLSPSESREYARYLASRPKRAEDAAIEMVIRLAEKHGTRVHIVHLSSASAIATIEKARDRGVKITAETCPHYLSLSSEEIPDGATAFKCAPPIREKANQENLWKGLKNEGIVQVVTDHSPSTPNLKCIGSGDFTKAWGGIASLQLGLAVVWTEARARGASIEDIAKWMCASTAKLIGQEKTKGSIVVGADADFCVWDPDAEFTVHASALQHRNKITPYENRKTFGSVVTTILRGETIYDRGDFKTPARGKHLCKTS
jgi:allantoinase